MSKKIREIHKYMKLAVEKYNVAHKSKLTAWKPACYMTVHRVEFEWTVIKEKRIRDKPVTNAEILLKHF